MNRLAQFVIIAAISYRASAQSQIWGQCGGIRWTGPTTCVAGSTCVFSNNWYSQCLPSASVPPSQPTTTFVPPPTTTVAPSPPTTTVATTPPGTPAGTAVIGAATGPGLNKVAKAAGWSYIGSATDNSELSDQPHINILKNTNEFGQITPANSMKWDATEPSQNSFSFSGGDQILNFAKANGQIVRGHNLVWYSQLPSWVTSGNWNNATLTAAMKNHITNVAGHYKGEVYCWGDVVNEPFNDDGTYRTDVFYNNIGVNYIAIALQTARQVYPNAKLYINDYNIEYAGAKATAMINLVKSLKSQGVPIDGIGVQGHLIVGQVPSTLQANLEAFAALGVEVAITELDIRKSLPTTAVMLAQQQKDYQTVIAACKAVSGCIGVTVWDYTDKYSWVPSTFSGQGAACPWDQNLGIKAAYNGILAGL